MGVSGSSFSSQDSISFPLIFLKNLYFLLEELTWASKKNKKSPKRLQEDQFQKKRELEEMGVPGST